MNLLFQAWNAATLAKLTRRNPIPTEQLGYGRDLSCVEDVTSDWREVDPQSNQAIGETLLRRLVTPRAALASDPDFGCGLPQLLNRGLTQRELADIRRLTEQECRKDDRVAAVTALVAFDTTDNALTVDVTVTPQDSRRTFALVLRLDGSGRIVAEVVDGAV